MISSMLEPASRFSKTVATGIRVSRNTHSPLRLSGTLSTAWHCDQSRVAISSSYLLINSARRAGESCSNTSRPPLHEIKQHLRPRSVEDAVRHIRGAVHDRAGLDRLSYSSDDNFAGA